MTVKRLNGQQARVLHRLREGFCGPGLAWNDGGSESIMPMPSVRRAISDLRKKGYVIKRDVKFGGWYLYERVRG